MMQFWRLAMINPSQLNLSTLPSVPLCDRRQLPTTSGIYFALSGGTVQYIGRSVNIQQRWAGHHRTDQLSAMQNPRIAYIAISDKSLLPEIETALIEWFDPPLNGYKHGWGNTGIATSATNTPRAGTVIIALKKVRELRGFSQNDLARETGYSTQHIQKIEQGRVKSVTLEALDRLCRALKCLPGELVEIVSEPPLSKDTVKKSQAKKRVTKGKTPDD